MDRIYRYQRHVYDATRAWTLTGRDRLLRGIEIPPGGAVLEMGCGTGRNLHRLARWRPDARLYGLDVSEQMLRTARRRLPTPLAGRIAYARAAAGAGDPREPFGRNEPFDAVFFSYSLSMMDERESALRATLTALSPRGSIHVVDFGGFESWPGAARAAILAWLSAWHVRPEPSGAQILRRLGLVVSEESLRGGYASLARAHRAGGAAP